MKRGLFGLISLVLLLSLPNVFAAETFLDLIFGTSNESILFLKVAYAMLVFIIFVKVSKETVFKKEQANLANMFALLLSFFTLRFTPDGIVQGFGWVIMAIAPSIIFYKLSSIFVKQEDGKFSWARTILATIATLILWFALGSTDAFGAGLGSTPGLGGFFDELFSDIHYFFFGSLGPFFVFLLIGIVLGLLFLLFGRLRGGTGAGGAFGNSWGRGLLLVLGIALLGALLGGLLRVGLPRGLLGVLFESLYWLGILALVILFIYLLYRFPGFRQVIWRIVRFLFWDLWRYIIGSIGFVLIRLWNWMRGLFGGRGPRTPLGNADLILKLQVGRNTVGDLAAGIPGIIFVNEGSTTPFIFTAYRRRGLLRNVRLDAANITVLRVNNGIIAPTTGATDARGMLRTLYTAPNVAGRARLHVEITHPDLNPGIVIPDAEITIGTAQDLFVAVPAVAAVDVGNAADIVVEVEDGITGAGVNGAAVEVVFPRNPGIGPFRGTTLGGAAARAAVLTLRTNPFPTAGTYNFIVTVTAPGYNAPAPIPGAITVNNPRIEDLEIFNVAGRVGRTLVSGTPAIPVRVGQRVDIELSVRVAGALPARMIDTATLSITPATNVTSPVRRGAGQYIGTFTPTAAEIGVQRFVIEARMTGYNNAVAYLDMEVEDLPTLNVAVRGPVAPFRSGMTGIIEIEISDAAGRALNAGVEIFQGTGGGRTSLATGRAGTSTVGGRAARTGLYYYPFTAPLGITRNVDAPFTIVVQERGYQGPVSIPLIVTIEALSAVDVNLEILDDTGSPLPATGNIYRAQTNETITFNVQVTDRASGNPVGGTVTFSPVRGTGFTLTNSIGTLSGTGAPHSAGFIATNVQRYPFSLAIRPDPGFVAPVVIPFIIQTLSAPALRVTVNWVPEPTTSNRYMLMNFVVLDDSTGNPVTGAVIRITDTHANSVLFDRAGPYRTNNTGQLATELRIRLGRVLVRGGSEVHRLDIEVAAGGYTTRTGTIDITFHPPRSRLGGPVSRAL